MNYTLILLIVFAAAPVRDDPLRPLGRISDPAIRETSGIVKSRRYPDVFWVLSDSGNPAVIHAIRRDGRVLATFRVAAPNVDWEEIAADGSGHLYLGDIGNNGGLLPIRAVHRIDEPDPFRPREEPSKVGMSSYYTFASKAERFDAEAFLIDGKSILLLTKRHDREEAEIERIPFDPPASLLRPAVARRVGRVPGFTEAVTGSSTSDDGRRLAVVSNRVVRVYDRGEAGGLTLRAAVRYKERDIEAIAWDGPDLILATEAGELFRLDAATWAP